MLGLHSVREFGYRLLPGPAEFFAAGLAAVLISPALVHGELSIVAVQKPAPASLGAPGVAGGTVTFYETRSFAGEPVFPVAVILDGSARSAARLPTDAQGREAVKVHRPAAVRGGAWLWSVVYPESSALLTFDQETSSWRVLVASGDASPLGGVFEAIGRADADASGRIVFHARLRDAIARQAVFACSFERCSSGAGSFEVVAQSGAEADGPGRLCSISPAVSAGSGATVFRARIDEDCDKRSKNARSALIYADADARLYEAARFGRGEDGVGRPAGPASLGEDGTVALRVRKGRRTSIRVCSAEDCKAGATRLLELPVPSPGARSRVGVPSIGADGALVFPGRIAGGSAGLFASVDGELRRLAGLDAGPGARITNMRAVEAASVANVVFKARLKRRERSAQTVILHYNATEGAGATTVGGLTGLVGGVAGTRGNPIQCGDFNADGNITASDALGTLQTAVGSTTCLPCVCDADLSSSITATDALNVLKFAVGQPVQLSCIADANPVSWDAGGDGVSWHDAANWSTDTLPQGCDAVTIGANGDNEIVVSEGDHAVHSVVSDAPLRLSSSGELTVRFALQMNGGDLLTMAGGTLAGAVVAPGTGGAVVVQFTNQGGTFEDVTLDGLGDLSNTSSFLRAVGIFTLNSELRMGASASITFLGSVAHRLDGSGSLVFALPNATPTLTVSSGGSLTIGPNMTVRGGRGVVGSSSTNRSVVVDGTVASDEPGKIFLRGNPLTINGSARASGGGELEIDGVWSNAAGGSVEVSGGSKLTLKGDWSNLGTISATESTTELGGNFSLAALGTFNRSGGTVDLISGSFDNTPGLALDAVSGDWNLRGGTIVGGTIDTSAGARFVFTSGGGNLDGVTINGQADMLSSSAFVRVQGDLTLNTELRMGASASITFSGGTTQTLSGNGSVVFDLPNATPSITMGSGTILTIGPSMTIRGGRGIVGSTSTNRSVVVDGTVASDEPGKIFLRGNPLTINGSARASGGGELEIDGVWSNAAGGSVEVSGGSKLTLKGDWSNLGTISATESTTELGGNFSLAALGTFNRSGGEVDLISGSFDNSAGLVLDATTGDWLLRGGTIVGGTIDTSAGARFVFTSGGGNLDGVTINGQADMLSSSAFVRVQGDLTLNTELRMGAAASITFNGGTTQTLGGTGPVVFDLPNATPSIVVGSGSTLLIGANMTVRGGRGVVGSSSTNRSVVVDGTVASDEPGKIFLRGNPLTINGSARASGGGELEIDGVWSNAAGGSVEVSGGSKLTLKGDWSNLGTISSTESTTELGGNFSLAALGTFNRSGGEVDLISGSFDNSAGLVLDATTGDWLLRGGTIVGGTIDTSAGARFVFTNAGGNLDGVTINGQADMLSSSAFVRVQGDLTLNTELRMGAAASITFNGGTTQTLGGTGPVVFDLPTATPTITMGSGTILTIGPSMTIRGGRGIVGTTSANRTLINQGTVDSDEPGKIFFRGGSWANPGILRASGGDLEIGGTGSNDGTIEVAAGVRLDARDGFAQEAGGTLVLEIAGAADFGSLDVTGEAALAGTLRADFTGGFDPGIGTTFAAIVYDSRSGDFGSLQTTGLSASLARSFDATTMTLEVQ